MIEIDPFPRMVLFDFRNAPPEFFNDGTHPRGSAVYEWYWSGQPEVLSDQTITRDTISTKWPKNELVVQTYVEHNRGTYTTRAAWQMVFQGSFSKPGRKMNGSISQIYNAYSSFRSGDQELGIQEGEVLASYKYSENVTWKINEGVTTPVASGQPNDNIPTDVWNKYFNGYFSYANPVSINGVTVLNLNGGSNSASSDVDKLIGTSKKADVLIFDRSPSFGPASAERIINFNPKEKDKIQIALGQFGLDIGGKFGIAKNTKNLSKILASSTDFAYLRSTGEIYFNENGAASGFGNGGIFAVVEGRPNLSPSNIEFF